VPTSRLEAFSDGVFAIAITLLVLEIRVPGQGESLSSALLHRWPSYFAYAVSFLTIGIMWVNHHQLFTFVKATDRKLLFVNLGLLLCVAFVPFPTSVVAEFIRNAGQARAAAVLYGVTFTVTAAFWQLLWYWAIKRPEILSERADRKALSAIDRGFWVGLPVYAAGTAVALGSPIASVAIFGAIAVFYVFERPLIRER
jgi:uncharacterized membrane protein